MEPRLPRRSAGHLLLSALRVFGSDDPRRTLWPCRSPAVMTAGGLFGPLASLSGRWCKIPGASSHSEGCWLVTVENDSSQVSVKWMTEGEGEESAQRQLPPGYAATLL